MANAPQMPSKIGPRKYVGVIITTPSLKLLRRDPITKNLGIEHVLQSNGHPEVEGRPSDRDDICR